jgi:hypothetical protein
MSRRATQAEADRNHRNLRWDPVRSLLVFSSVLATERDLSLHQILEAPGNVAWMKLVSDASIGVRPCSSTKREDRFRALLISIILLVPRVDRTFAHLSIRRQFFGQLRRETIRPFKTLSEYSPQSSECFFSQNEWTERD